MKAADLVTIAIDAETVGKICALASNTMSVPDNDSCESMAVNLLDKALDAALAVFGPDHEGVVNLCGSDVKLELAHPQYGSTESPAPKSRKRKGGSER
jgi:hypothetical protein